jgi:hypothetical protein
MGVPKERGHSCGVSIEEVLISEQATDTRHWFQALSTTFDKSLDRGSLVVLVSGARPYYLNPIVDSGWETVLAMLILAFPEARWMFGTIQGYEEADDRMRKDLDQFRFAHGIGNLFHPDQSALFDGDGLRDWVRWRASEETKGDARYLSRRKENQVAFSLDDESRYSYLHAYTAYRFGFRAVAINSTALAAHLLGQNVLSPIPLLVFEDIYISFIDGKRGMSWLGLNPADETGRAKEWPRLGQARFRIFVTSGQQLPGDEVKRKRNSAYIAEQKTKRAEDGHARHLRTLYKPYAGIFRLWEEAGLSRKLCWQDAHTGKLHHGIADGFHWPPPEGSFSSSEHGHSSPGVLLAIAEKLIERAEKLLPNVRSVQDAVHGAVWATDALEILGGRTPTIAIEALKLKHHFEVIAECQFTGVEDQIQLRERFDEIDRDVKMISHWFGPSQQGIAALNAEMKIVVDLVRVFREFTQFEEELLCLQKVRKLHRRIWFQRGNPWRSAIYPFRWYVESLLGSVPRFVGAIALWLLFLTLLYALMGNAPLTMALKAAFVSFVAIQPNDPDPNFAVTMLAMLSGATHLGIFISHLYALVSRK